MSLPAAIPLKVLLWAGLALPACYMVPAYARGEMVYGAFLHWTGEVAAWLLLFTLALTPIRLLFPRRRWPLLLLRQRRSFGVASFLYAALHTAAYLLRQPWARVTKEAVEYGMLAGWIAFAIFMALAATSNDASVRALGRRWQGLHRWVYPAAALTFAHWVLTAFDPLVGAAHAGALGVIVALRLGAAKRISDRFSRPR